MWSRQPPSFRALLEGASLCRDHSWPARPGRAALAGEGRPLSSLVRLGRCSAGRARGEIDGARNEGRSHDSSDSDDMGGHNDVGNNHAIQGRTGTQRGRPGLRPGGVRGRPAGRDRLLQPDLRHRRDRQRARVHRQRPLRVRQPAHLGLDHADHRRAASPGGGGRDGGATRWPAGSAWPCSGSTPSTRCS